MLTNDDQCVTNNRLDLKTTYALQNILQNSATDTCHFYTNRQGFSCILCFV